MCVCKLQVNEGTGGFRVGVVWNDDLNNDTYLQ